MTKDEFDDYEASKADVKKINGWSIILYSVLGLLIIALIVKYFLMSSPSHVANLLDEQGFKLYTLYTCVYCDAQKDLFDEHVDKLTIVECSASEDELCQHLPGVPAWLTPDGKVVTGNKGLAELYELAHKCKNEKCPEIEGVFLK